MKNVKRVYNATRDRWVKIICKDEPKPVEVLAEMFKAGVRAPPEPPARDSDKDRGR